MNEVDKKRGRRPLVVNRKIRKNDPNKNTTEFYRTVSRTNDLFRRFLFYFFFFSERKEEKKKKKRGRGSDAEREPLLLRYVSLLDALVTLLAACSSLTHGSRTFFPSPFPISSAHFASFFYIPRRLRARAIYRLGKNFIVVTSSGERENLSESVSHINGRRRNSSLATLIF